MVYISYEVEVVLQKRSFLVGDTSRAGLTILGPIPTQSGTPPLPFPSLPLIPVSLHLEVDPLKSSQGIWGSL